MADIDTFFREATLRICGSLDIQTVAESCLEYLKDYIPLDGITITHYDEMNRSLIYLAAASNFPLNLGSDKTIRISQESHEWYMLNKSALTETVYIFNEREKPPIHMDAWKSLNCLDTSSIMLRVAFDEKRLGQVNFFCRGPNRYSREHADLVLQLYEPFSIALANALHYREILHIKGMLENDNQALRNELYGIPHAGIIGSHGGMKEVMDAAKQVAPMDCSVLLLGETGVGKEVVCTAIHTASPRKNGPFVKVNCGAIPQGLVNTELFGHEKGAFSGAVTRKPGFFELADGGTLFLDEIGDLPLHAQAVLLRVLQEGELWRVGGTKPVKADVRVIAATNRDLEKMVRERTFRQDLWFRLNVFPIVIPPLRDRKNDIPDLVLYFIMKKSREMNLGGMPVILPGTMDKLKAYDWPGNVRELENIVERALIRWRARGSKEPLEFDDVLIPLSADPNPLQPADPYPLTAQPEGGSRRWRTLDEVMKEHIQATLEKTGGRVQGPGSASSLLRIKPNTLRNRMRKLGIPFGKNALPRKADNENLS
ncbi:MAG: sigma 54-interacting transcriptional regulator [Desulfomonilia bacterium]